MVSVAQRHQKKKLLVLSHTLALLLELLFALPFHVPLPRVHFAHALAAVASVQGGVRVTTATAAAARTKAPAQGPATRRGAAAPLELEVDLLLDGERHKLKAQADLARGYYALRDHRCAWNWLGWSAALAVAGQARRSATVRRQRLAREELDDLVVRLVAHLFVRGES